MDLYQPAMDERHHELMVDLEDHVVVDADSEFVESRSEQSDRERNRSLTGRMPDSDSAAVARGISGTSDRRQWSGFPPEISSRAFERFVRGEHSHGHGLGLAFVDAVVRAHGGTARISDGPQWRCCHNPFSSR